MLMSVTCRWCGKTIRRAGLIGILNWSDGETFLCRHEGTLEAHEPEPPDTDDLLALERELEAL